MTVCEHGSLKRQCRICELEVEIEEQARLLGAGASREAKLMAERDAAVRERDALRVKFQGSDERGRLLLDAKNNWMDKATRLREALVIAAIPLEALNIAEWDKQYLSSDLKQAIRNAIDKIRAALGEGKP